MKNIIYFLLSLSFLVYSCKDFKYKNISDCIHDEINLFKNNLSCEQGSAVGEYRFQEQLVYVFTEGNCGADFAAEVKDSECNSLGFLSGISGNTIINNEDFSNATFLQIIWQFE